MARSVPCFAFVVFRYREDAEEAQRKADGSEVVAEYELVTTTTVTEHEVIGASDECVTNCVFNDFVMVYNSDVIHAWAHDVKDEYD